jgi:hypothetical protein
MTPRKGDRVRVTYEAVYVEQIPSFGSTRHILRVDASDRRPEYSAPPDATLEVIEDLRPGDVYRDKDGDLGVYVGGEERPWLLLTIMGKVRRDGMTEQLPDLILVRPLTLLVRDGESVTP